MILEHQGGDHVDEYMAHQVLLRWPPWARVGDVMGLYMFYENTSHRSCTRTFWTEYEQEIIGGKGDVLATGMTAEGD